jgi:hypothetical protein
MATQLERTEEQIRKVKQALLALGPMRPGTITRQYRLPKEKKRPFYQISYTHRAHFGDFGHRFRFDTGHLIGA